MLKTKWIYLAEDLQLLLVFVIGRQRRKLLQQHGARWRGDVQEELEGLVDGAGGDTSLVCPVTDYACRRRKWFRCINVDTGSRLEALTGVVKITNYDLSGSWQVLESRKFDTD